jgi:hypothetical protein
MKLKERQYEAPGEAIGSSGRGNMKLKERQKEVAGEAIGS